MKSERNVEPCLLLPQIVIRLYQFIFVRLHLYCLCRRRIARNISNHFCICTCINVVERHGGAHSGPPPFNLFIVLNLSYELDLIQFEE